MEQLYEAGKIRAIGVSNWAVRHFRDIEATAKVSDASPPKKMVSVVTRATRITMILYHGSWDPQKHTLIYIYTHSHTRSLSLSLSLSLSYTHFLSHTHILALTHMH